MLQLLYMHVHAAVAKAHQPHPLSSCSQSLDGATMMVPPVVLHNTDFLLLMRLQLTFDTAQDYSMIDLPGRFHYQHNQRVAVAFDWASASCWTAYGFLPFVKVGSSGKQQTMLVWSRCECWQHAAMLLISCSRQCASNAVWLGYITSAACLNMHTMQGLMTPAALLRARQQRAA